MARLIWLRAANVSQAAMVMSACGSLGRNPTNTCAPSSRSVFGVSTCMCSWRMLTCPVVRATVSTSSKMVFDSFQPMTRAVGPPPPSGTSAITLEARSLMSLARMVMGR